MTPEFVFRLSISCFLVFSGCSPNYGVGRVNQTPVMDPEMMKLYDGIIAMTNEFFPTRYNVTDTSFGNDLNASVEYLNVLNQSPSVDLITDLITMFMNMTKRVHRVMGEFQASTDLTERVDLRTELPVELVQYMVTCMLIRKAGVNEDDSRIRDRILADAVDTLKPENTSRGYEDIPMEILIKRTSPETTTKTPRVYRYVDDDFNSTVIVSLPFICKAVRTVWLPQVKRTFPEHFCAFGSFRAAQGYWLLSLRASPGSPLLATLESFQKSTEYIYEYMIDFSRKELKSPRYSKAPKPYNFDPLLGPLYLLAIESLGRFAYSNIYPESYFEALTNMKELEKVIRGPTNLS
jgi:hypothetical protein